MELKKRLLENAPEIFNKDTKAQPGPDVKAHHAKIGQLSMEKDFLSHALGVSTVRALSKKNIF